MFSKLHEECGVFGIYDRDGTSDVVTASYLALYALQHRGQESCGIAVNDDGVIFGHNDVGLVGDVFTKPVLMKLPRGRMAIGHVRYGTTGTKSRMNAQPLIINHVKGSMALAHNGSLTNADALRESLEMAGAIFHTTSDIEVIAYILTKERLTAASIEQAVERAMDKLEGAYSLVVMSPTKMIAARDKRGFHPLCIGKLGESYVVASETCALDSIGAAFLREVEPGEIVLIKRDGLHSLRAHCEKEKSKLCIFEFIYFARPDSVIHGSSVHTARQRAGAFLAIDHPADADVVIGVPDSGIDAAVGFAKQSGIPYGVGFIKNKYIGRTFIQPTQKQRDQDVGIKLNPVSATVAGKRVVLVDDSIVRGTTCARIVKQLRKAGAAEVHMRVTAPPFLHPCYFGVDIDSRENLIATNHTVDEIRRIIGVDSLGYLDINRLAELPEHTACGFCDACFTGDYPIPVPEARSKLRFETKLSERQKKESPPNG